MDETLSRKFDPTAESRRTLDRILPRIEEQFAAKIKAQPQAWPRFISRLDKHYPRLLNCYSRFMATITIFFITSKHS